MSESMLSHDASDARERQSTSGFPPSPSGPPAESPTPPGDSPAAPRPPSGAGRTAPDPADAAAQWPERVTNIAGYTCQWVGRPRVRLALTGILLLVIGGVFVTNSVWTLPVVVVGALMVLVAWMGHRLEGRFAVEWGATGTELAFRATVRAATPPADEAPRAAGSEPGQPTLHQSAAGSEEDEIIEGEAHTVEIDVAELKALIAAAGTATPVADIRIRRAVDRVGSPPPPR
jgi:hypothetical protein